MRGGSARRSFGLAGFEGATATPAIASTGIESRDRIFGRERIGVARDIQSRSRANSESGRKTGR